MAEMGRPKNYSTADIKNVIDMYVSFTGGTVLLNASKIAEYAEKKLGISSFKYYVINRNLETKNYVKELNTKIYENSGRRITSAVTAFTQIDIQLYQRMNKEQLGKALTNLSTLIEDMANSNTKLLKENIAFKNTIREKNIEIKKMAQNYTENVEQLNNKNNEQRDLIKKLIQSVKRSDDIFHLLWDKEAEMIMKQTGVFKYDKEKSNQKRTITDIEESIIHVADVNMLVKKESEEISKKFMDRLNNL